LWFLPLLVLGGMVGLAYLLIWVDHAGGEELRWDLPLVISAEPEGARATLATIAGSMITVAGVVFSITIVALSQASTQYSPRILRNFMRDRSNQLVLGVFVGIYAYCMVVLRNITGHDDDAFVPVVAVLAGFLLSVVGIGFLIYFIHHIATSIQASEMIAAIAEETDTAVREMYVEEVRDEAIEEKDNSPAQQDCEEWHAVPSLDTGYIQWAEVSSLSRLATERNLIVRVDHGIGDFIIKGRPLACVANCGVPDDELIAKVNACYGIDNFRTVDQDPAFGLRQIVDIALKALSPGINDTGTAITCVDYLSAILCHMAPLRLHAIQHRMVKERQVIVKNVSFTTLLAEAYDQIIPNAKGNSAVLLHLLRSLGRIAQVTPLRSRRECLRVHLESIAELVEQSVASSRSRQLLRDRIEEVRREIQ
jgi:uncharacterized membrane protein